MNFSQLKFVKAASEFKSFSKAAQFCHVTQPTLKLGAFMYGVHAFSSRVWIAGIRGRDFAGPHGLKGTRRMRFDSNGFRIARDLIVGQLP